MGAEISAGVLAALLGSGVAFINYLMSKRVLCSAPDKYAITAVVRQLLQIGFLAAVYFVAPLLTEAEPVYPLIGAVLGMTLPMLFFTKKLLKVNKAVNEGSVKEEEEKNG